MIKLDPAPHEFNWATQWKIWLSDFRGKVVNYFNWPWMTPHATGSFTVPEGHGAVMVGPLELASGETAAVETDSTLVIL